MPTISQLPADQRPREKLLRQGAASLSDIELLAIFLRVGVKGKSAIELAEQLLMTFGGLPALLSASEADFCAQYGLGSAKYVHLQAVLEMAKRYYLAQLKESVVIDNTEIAVQLLSDKLATEPREIVCALWLNSKHHLICVEDIAVGSLREAALYPREIAKQAFKHNAAALILAHNHPSGDPSPSNADIRITQKLSEILKPLDIKLVDHIIIGQGLRYHSLAAMGLCA